MTLFGSWLRSRKARYDAEHERALVETSRQQRINELVREPHKSMSELLELRHLTEAWDPLFGPARLDWLKADLGRMMSFERGALGTGGWTSKQGARGAQPPLYQSEGELCLLRDASRILVADYPKAEGLLRNVGGYVLGDGVTVQVTPRTPDDKEAAAVARKCCDEFADRIGWEVVQEEFFFCSRRDGDAWLRTFSLEDGRTDLRQIWPEQIRWPHGESSDTAGYGVFTPPDDKQKVEGYAVYPVDSTADDDYEYVPAEEMVGMKVNVDAGVSRGVPDYCFSMKETLQGSQKLGYNMGQASIQQASIAFIRQHTGVKRAQIEAFRTADADFQRPNLYTGTDINVKEGLAGTIIDTNENTEFKESPFTGGIAGFIEVQKVLDRTAAVKFAAPEWMVNGDASSNSYANALSQESPFVNRVKSFQRRYSRPYRQLFERVLLNAAASGRFELPPDILQRVEVKVTMPSPMVRNKLEEAQEADLRLKNGTISPQTVCNKAGDEWDEEIKNRKQAVAEGWQAPAGQPTDKPSEPDGLPKTTYDENGQPRQPSQNGIPKAVKERLESLREDEHDVSGEKRDESGKWTKGAFAAAVNALPAGSQYSDPSKEHYDPSKEHGFPFDKAVQGWKRFPKPEEVAKAPIVQVPVDSLIATQRAVAPQHLMTKFETGDSGPVDVMRFQGKLYIIDGHHKATIARITGQKNVKARLFDLDVKGGLPKAAELAAA